MVVFSLPLKTLKKKYIYITNYTTPVTSKTAATANINIIVYFNLFTTYPKIVVHNKIKKTKQIKPKAIQCSVDDMAPFDSESKEALTWLIPSASLVLMFIAPLFNDIRLYILGLFLIVYLNYIADFDETKVKTIKMKKKSLACAAIIYSWFIYSDLFKHSNTPSDTDTISVVASIIHVAMSAISSVFDRNSIHNFFLLANGISVSFIAFNLVYEYILFHVYTQIFVFVIAWYIEMITDALFETKRNISIAYLVIACLPFLRSSEIIMYVYGVIFLTTRTWELVDKHYPALKIKEITALPKPPPMVIIDVKEEEEKKEEPIAPPPSLPPRPKEKKMAPPPPIKKTRSRKTPRTTTRKKRIKPEKPKPSGPKIVGARF